MESNMRVEHFVQFLLFLCLVGTCASSRSDHKYSFVLVHGANHGAWCWYKVSTLLKQSGHNVTTLDLAASGIDQTQIQQVTSVAVYVDPLMKFMESLPPKQKVVLVGHSMGGVPIALAMERFPHKISVAVFATASMPGPDLTYVAIRQELGRHLDFVDSHFRFDDGASKPATSVLRSQEILAPFFYQLSPPEDLTLALTLVRYAPTVREDLKFTKKKYGSVRRVYIMCDQDLVIKVDVARFMIQNNPPDEVKVINGSDHMVMFSRPLELFSNLQQIAEKYS
ncbi:PREDICTED: methylesterase 3-like [Fragaria vesca subsp. vesca]|uniref:methylesterase 3-like n=1 Tax=Fragaria vesca subsp. vesca TaxID=101020 RepID=UPI0002C3517D|nr:PREDICTED: methylesterase 3-like [Fragaria vesca subsp. vesca]